MHNSYCPAWVKYKLLQSSPEGISLVGENIEYDQQVARLAKARRICFGRKGKISYTQLTATCENSVLYFVVQD